MSSTDCARAWQAEAGRDGRLSDADRASFERHAEACAICATELRALVEIDDAASHLPILSSTPLERRRSRNELLRRVNDLVVRAPPRAFPMRALVATVAVLVLVGMGVFALGSRHPSPPIAFSPGAPTYRLTASEGARWRLANPGPTLGIDVQSGRFELDVDRLAAGQRFLLNLPDGELEVQGTRFVVDVEPGRTRRVSVHEGRVALRLVDRAPLVLVAGDVWPARTAQAPDPHPETVATPAPREPVLRPPPARSAPPTAATPPSAGSDFALAMSAFSAGDFARAEALFASFEAGHPKDGRVEDATFLRAVARSRRGDASGARQLASEYLRRYPKGLRRLEAERLAGSEPR